MVLSPSVAHHVLGRQAQLPAEAKAKFLSRCRCKRKDVCSGADTWETAGRVPSQRPIYLLKLRVLLGGAGRPLLSNYPRGFGWLRPCAFNFLVQALSVRTPAGEGRALVRKAGDAGAPRGAACSLPWALLFEKVRASTSLPGPVGSRFCSLGSRRWWAL